MALYTRRPDGLALLDGVPAPLALSDAQLTGLGHTPAPALTRPNVPPELRGLPPGALAQGPGPSPLQGYVNKLDGVPAPAVAPRHVAPTPLSEMPFGPPLPPPAAPEALESSGFAAATAPAERAAATQGESRVPDAPPMPGSAKSKSTTTLPDAPRGLSALGAGGRGRLVKGGIQLAGYKQQMGVPISDADMTDAVGLKRTEGEAAEQKYGYDLKAEAGVVSKEADELAFQHARLAGEREKRKLLDEGIRDAETKWQQREQSLGEMASPKMKDFWADKGIAGRIGAAITIIAGGALQGYQGQSSNSGMAMFQQIHGQWVDEKREEFERAKDATVRAKTRYGQMLELYGTPEEADKALRAEAAIVTGKQIENYAKMMTIPGKVATLQALQAQNGQEVIKLRNELLTARQGTIEKTFINRPDQYVGGGAAKPKGMDRMVRLPGGGYAWARSEVDARKVQDQVTALGSLKRDAQLLLELSKQAGNRIPMGDAKAQMQTIKTRMMLTTKNAEQMGALDKGTQEVFDQMVGTPEDIINAGASGHLSEIVGGADAKVNDLARDYLHADPDAVAPVVEGEPTGVEYR